MLTLMLLEDGTDVSIKGVEWSAGQGVVEQGGGGQGFLAGFKGCIGQGRPLDLYVSTGSVRCD